MSGDSKRLPAPESIPYHLNARHKTKTYEEKLATTLAGGKRQDSRPFQETRKICKFQKFDCSSELNQEPIHLIYFFLFLVLKSNVIAKAKGSAYIEMGNTKVIVSVFDPREIVNKQTNSRQEKNFQRFEIDSF